MKREAEKKKGRNVPNSKSEKNTLSAADLAKKPIGVRRKSTKPSEIDSGDSKYIGGLSPKLSGREKTFTKLTWKSQKNIYNPRTVNSYLGNYPIQSSFKYGCT